MAHPQFVNLYVYDVSNFTINTSFSEENYHRLLHRRNKNTESTEEFSGPYLRVQHEKSITHDSLQLATINMYIWQTIFLKPTLIES